jgi:hypothetical protein
MHTEPALPSKAFDAALRAVQQNHVYMPVKPTAEMIEAAGRAAKLTPAQIVAVYSAMVAAAQDGDAQDGGSGAGPSDAGSPGQERKL